MGWCGGPLVGEDVVVHRSGGLVATKRGGRAAEQINWVDSFACVVRPVCLPLERRLLSHGQWIALALCNLCIHTGGGVPGMDRQTDTGRAFVSLGGFSSI